MWTYSTVAKQLSVSILCFKEGLAWATDKQYQVNSSLLLFKVIEVSNWSLVPYYYAINNDYVYTWLA